MTDRLVYCVKLKQNLPALKRPPFGGELGQRIFAHISQSAWNLWRQQQIIIINHYGLNMVDPRATALLMKECEKFLFEEDVAMPDEWVDENTDTSGMTKPRP
ncbi:MAG TPA: oxidative damage protection protein [Anaerolineales bacterium]|nr:oxidative damage protection protein [Anaerolineales bacterium]